jgi:hypothetical protein
VLACDLGTTAEALPGDARLAVCEALADFADLKSAQRGLHSHTVATLTAQAAAALGLPQGEQDRLRRAALVHDLGKIAVPYRLLEQAADDTGPPARPGRSAALSEPVRLHPHYAQRILARVRPLADLAADVGAHHERLDGYGYPSGSPAATCRPAPGCWPPPTPGPNAPAAAPRTCPARTAWTRRAWPPCSPAPSPAPAAARVDVSTMVTVIPFSASGVKGWHAPAGRPDL